MPTYLQRSLAFVAVAIALLLMVSQGVQAKSVERIRPAAPLLKTAIATALDRSATFRALVDRIEQSDVIAYLTCTSFASVTMVGRTLFVTAGSDVRYVRVQLLCDQGQPALITIIAHELQHVVEIASNAWVVDDQSFARLLSTIGFSTCIWRRPDQFETRAGFEAGKRVRSELLHYSENGFGVGPKAVSGP
jgi:hypothetical protein